MLCRPFSLAIAIGLAILPAAASGQEFPTRSIALIIPAPPGGTNDLGGRIVAKGLADALGRPVVPENRAGAAAVLGAAVVARAAPDGYTIGALANAGVTSPFAIGRNVPYKLEDLDPIGTVLFDYSIVIVKPDARWKTIEEVMRFARENPDKLSYSAVGIGSIGQFNMEFLKLPYGAQMELVSYPGSPQVITSVLGGHVELGSANVSVALPHIKAGMLRGLTVGSPKRLLSLPDVPAVGELGKGEPPSFWVGIFVPAKTPRPIVDKLASTLEQVLKDASIRSQLDKAGLVVDYRNPAETRKLIAQEIETMAKIAKTLNLK